LTNILRIREARVLARVLVCILITIPLLYSGSFANAQVVDVLQTAKSDSPDPVEAGEDLTYVVTVTNVHLATPSDGNLNDTLPTSTSLDGVTWTADAASASCGKSPGGVTCTFTDLEANGGQLIVTITVVPTEAGVITNTVTATSTTPVDPTTNNNTASTTTTVQAASDTPDIQVDKSDSPDPVGQGEELDYFVTVTNASDAGFADQVFVTDTLPDSTEFVTVTWSGTAPGVCGYDGTNHQVTCTFSAFQASDVVRLTITVIPFEQGVITNEVDVSATDEEAGDLANNSASENTTVEEGDEADIGVTKTDTPDPVARGATLTYKVTVTVTSGFAETVRVTDTLPSSFEFGSVEWEDSGSCAYDSSSHRVLCTFNDMFSGDFVRVTITGTPTQSGVITNTVSATTSSEVSPTTLADNTDTETTTVSASAAADLATQKSDSPDPVDQGGILTYRVTVTNNGGFAAQVRVTDTLPASADFLSLDWTGPGTCAYNSGPHNVTCIFSNMSQGETATIMIEVSPRQSGVITNTVTATTSDETGDTLGNNTDSETTNVTPAPIVNVVKTDSPDPVFVGSDLVYRVTVTNSGGGSSELRVTDTLPSQVTFKSASWFGPSPNNCAYNTANHQVTCTFSNFSTSSVASITITVTPNTNGTIANVVLARAGQSQDSDTENTTVFASERDQRGDRVDVFVRGGDGAVWHRSFNGAAWSPYESLGGFIQGDPSAVSWDNGRIDVFVRGGDDALWHMYWNGSSWSAWESLGGVITSGPDASSWGPNRLDVFVRGGDNALWHMSWGGTSWSAWESLGGVMTTDPSAVSWSTNRVDVFVIGGDSGLWHKSWNGSSWSAYEPLGGFFTSAPDASSWAPNRLDAFGRGGDNAMWHISWNGGAWSAYESIGGVFTSAPGAVSAANNTLDVFGRGGDNALWWNSWNGSAWSGWSSLGGILSAGPDASSWSNPSG
jgi:uncharacterized repeat protein (TIGR01451 family)/fimbrial isopeptide formation D2 family protein